LFFCSLETQRNGLVFIYDMTNSKYHNFDYELSIKILSMLKVTCLFLLIDLMYLQGDVSIYNNYIIIYVFHMC